jgi:hypothetical protein
VIAKRDGLEVASRDPRELFGRFVGGRATTYPDPFAAGDRDAQRTR